jgi:plastocyanin
MSGTNRSWIAGVGIVGAAAAIAAMSWLPLGAANRESEVHEVTLVVRNMAFHPVGEPGIMNPALVFRAGSRVRVTLRNEEPGVTHNFAIPAWDVDSGNLVGTGELRVEFVVPQTRGPEAYLCTPHARMMRGQIVVQ